MPRPKLPSTEKIKEAHDLCILFLSHDENVRPPDITDLHRASIKGALTALCWVLGHNSEPLEVFLESVRRAKATVQ